MATVVLLTINRPETLNELNLVVKNQLADLIEQLVVDDAVRAIVLTGAGGYFVACTDIAEMFEMSPIDHTRLETDRVFNVLRRCPKTLIAAVEGYELGGRTGP